MLKGPLTGTRDLFGNPLPVRIDNISFNGIDNVWLGAPSIRDDSLAAKPFIGMLLGSLPLRLLRPADSPSIIFGLDLQGALVDNLQHSEAFFRAITSVYQRQDQLYMGSL